jgi:putative colanic acid biosynthesis UDP-glucose lipid carrier transferase
MNKGFIRHHSNALGFIYRGIDALQIIFILYVCVISSGSIFGPVWSLAGLTYVVLFWIYAEIFTLYRSWRSSSYAEMAFATLSTWIISITSLIVIGYLFDFSNQLDKHILLKWMVVSFFILNSWRWLFRHVLFWLRRNNHNTRSAIIVGLTKSGIQLFEEINKNPQIGVRFEGFYDDRPSERAEVTFSGCKGNINDAVELAKTGQVDRIYIALPLYATDRTNQILSLFSDSTATVYIIPDLFEYQLLHAQWSSIGNVTTLSVHDSPIHGMGGWIKRAEDFILAILFLSILIIPMLVIGLLVKITSKGPVIFAQKRYGLDGRSISVYKFRSMKTMDNGDVIKQATRNDSRLTSIGGFLRSSSLDELPQFINVLQGTMSIVGPRPHAITHNEEYRKIIRGYMLRHKVKPGITGWAQVNGWRGETETLEKMEYRIKHDLEYINGWSLFFDIKIIIQTVFNGTLMNRNNY